MPDMDDKLNNESLTARIQQLEHERDELHKDIEQLCMQQAGSGYLAVATRMHFQRTAGLEQEIENLTKRLNASTRENANLQEELSEAYRIKSQLADLLRAEVAKNMESEKQVKFFQDCVAAAFSERDHSLLQAEKAKEEEELVSRELSKLRKRMDELSSDFLKEKNLASKLKVDLEEQERLNGTFKKVINRFYETRQHCLEGFFEDTTWEEKCESLLGDSAEMWSFKDDPESSRSKYISALEEEVEKLRKSVDNLQRKLHLGLEIENHLKKKVRELQKKKILYEEMIKKGISGLLHYHSQHRIDMMNLLDEGYSHIKAITDLVEEKISQCALSNERLFEFLRKDVETDKSERPHEHASKDAGPDLTNKSAGLSKIVVTDGDDASEVLAQALQEKVATLLLLSQQEERHLLERNVNAALQKKTDELQKNLLQVTNEKVRALMELAQVKQQYQRLREKSIHEQKQGKLLGDVVGEKTAGPERDGRLKNLLKKTYLSRWVGTTALDSSDGGEEAGSLNYEANLSSNQKYNCSIDFARIRIENATLKETLENMEHLTSSVRRLRFSLQKVKELASTSEGGRDSTSSNRSGGRTSLDEIVREAKLLRTALGSSLPVSWSGEEEDIVEYSGDGDGESKGDLVSAAGFEMVETLILGSEILRDHLYKIDSS